VYDDKMEAARAADRLAELASGESRDYDEAWQAGSRYADLGRDVSELRKVTLETIREAKEAARTMCGVFPSLGQVVQAAIRRNLDQITSLRDKRKRLQESFGGSQAFLEGQG